MRSVCRPGFGSCHPVPQVPVVTVMTFLAGAPDEQPDIAAARAPAARHAMMPGYGRASLVRQDTRAVDAPAGPDLAVNVTSLTDHRLAENHQNHRLGIAARSAGCT